MNTTKALPVEISGFNLKFPTGFLLKEAYVESLFDKIVMYFIGEEQYLTRHVSLEMTEEQFEDWVSDINQPVMSFSGKLTVFLSNDKVYVREIKDGKLYFTSLNLDEEPSRIEFSIEGQDEAIDIHMTTEDWDRFEDEAFSCWIWHFKKLLSEAYEKAEQEAVE